MSNAFFRKSFCFIPVLTVLWWCFQSFSTQSRSQVSFHQTATYVVKSLKVQAGRRYGWWFRNPGSTHQFEVGSLSTIIYKVLAPSQVFVFRISEPSNVALIYSSHFCLHSQKSIYGLPFDMPFAGSKFRKNWYLMSQSYGSPPKSPLKFDYHPGN